MIDTIDTQMAVQKTSIKMYRHLSDIGDIGKQQAEVWEAFEIHGDHTDNEIASLMGLTDYHERGRVCPRRNELVKLGYIEEKSKRLCNITRNKCIVWGIARHKINEAKKYIKLDKIYKRSHNEWILCSKYNDETITYLVSVTEGKSKLGKFMCNCDHFLATRFACVHIIAVKLYENKLEDIDID
jgi:hypothetical protein